MWRWANGGRGMRTSIIAPTIKVKKNKAERGLCSSHTRAQDLSSLWARGPPLPRHPAFRAAGWGAETGCRVDSKPPGFP